MVSQVERGEGNSDQGRARMSGMVTGGSQEEGVYDVPWTPFKEQRDLEWFYPRDKEITPLLDSGTTEENKDDMVPL